MNSFPEAPELPASHHGEGSFPVRYEDISQEGRLMLGAMPNAYGEVVFRGPLQGHPMWKARRERGVVPILTRLAMEGGEGPISVNDALSGTGAYQVARVNDARGEIERLVLVMWATILGKRARTYGPPPEGAGAPLVAGRVFAEHVFTRPFAPPGERRVVSLDVPGLAEPEAVYDFKAAETLLSLPDGATPLDDEAPDTALTAFSLGQTDSNQHVNSLVYPRLFEESAARRFAALGLDTAVLARRVEIAYRKPCFAGDRARFVLRAFRLGDRLGAVGRLCAEGPGGPLLDARPHCVIQTIFGA